VSGGRAPGRVASGPDNAKAVFGLIRDGFVNTCHDCSEGGLAVALAEMAIGGQTGCTIDLSRVPKQDALTDANVAFSESNSRYILEVTPENLSSVEKDLEGLEHAVIGTTGGAEVTILSGNGRDFVRASVALLAQSHHTPVL
jgi:phosphoribosylformylglycinamidine (FGAM) synthase-like enzyme